MSKQQSEEKKKQKEEDDAYWEAEAQKALEACDQMNKEKKERLIKNFEGVMQSTDDFAQLRVFKKEEKEPQADENFNIFAKVREEEKKQFEED